MVKVVEDYEALREICEERWEALAASVYKEVPDFISSMFGDFLKNPLCLSITSLLLFVAGVIVLRNIIRSFGSCNL